MISSNCLMCICLSFTSVCSIINASDEKKARVELELGSPTYASSPTSPSLVTSPPASPASPLSPSFLKLVDRRFITPTLSKWFDGNKYGYAPITQLQFTTEDVLKISLADASSLTLNIKTGKFDISQVYMQQNNKPYAWRDDVPAKVITSSARATATANNLRPDGPFPLLALVVSHHYIDVHNAIPR